MSPRKFVWLVSAVLTLILLCTGCGPQASPSFGYIETLEHDLRILREDVDNLKRVAVETTTMHKSLFVITMELHELLNTDTWRRWRDFNRSKGNDV